MESQPETNRKQFRIVGEAETKRKGRIIGSMKLLLHQLLLHPYPVNYDWKNKIDRTNFEDMLKRTRDDRSKWSFGKKIEWFFRLIISQFVIVLILYGSVAYTIIR